jgi:hypothetical protein
MIIKKIPTSRRAPPKSKAVNVRALVDYIAEPRADGDGEKVEHRGALNLLNVDHNAQVQEMIDLAETARRSPQPVQHWVMSWREGEQPTAAQADEAVVMFLDEMGLSGHQLIYALHRDTQNCHLHLAVNRVHPDTEKLVTVNNGFDHEVAHRAIARIEHRQGWQREDRALFLALPNGQMERTEERGAGGRRPSTGARDFEERAGARSAQRIALEEAAPIIRGARRWADLHEALARKGIRFEKKGSGAILWIGDEPVKASSAGRECSMAALCNRLGDFAAGPPNGGPNLPTPSRHLVEPVPPFWTEYVESRSRHERDRVAARQSVAEQQREGWRRMSERHRRERADILGGSWAGRRELMNAARSVLAARQAQEKAALRDQQKARLAFLRRENARFPSFRDWLADTSPDLAQRWRHRDRRPATIEGPTFEPPAPHDIRAFSPVIDGVKVNYHLAGQRCGPAFTDRGKVIDIYDSQGRASVLAALQLSAQKWGGFTVHGNEHFRRLCVELAVEHGFKIANPELQQALAADRVRLRAKGVQPEPATPAPSLAEAYRRHLAAEVAHLPHPGSSDPSRLDAQVAVRLRVAGYRRDAIAQAIREAAPMQRPNERRDWDRYAQRTADFAFSLPGSQLADHLARQRNIQDHQVEWAFEERLGGRLKFDRVTVATRPTPACPRRQARNPFRRLPMKQGGPPVDRPRLRVRISESWIRATST